MRVMPCTHRAAVCTALEGPDCVTTSDVPDAQAGPGTVRVAVRAAGVNYPDYLLTRGEYQLKLEPPFTPGMEVAGIVAECGPTAGRSTPWPVGAPVIAWTACGGFAEQVVVNTDAVFALPEPFSFAEGAAFTVAACTAYHALVERGGLQSGERLLVLGATGGVGFAAVQLAKLLGAQVVAVGSDDAKLAAVSAAGADHVVNYRDADLAHAVAALTSGIDVVFDAVGGDVATRAIRLLAWGGRYLVVGFASGTIPEFKANRILLNGISVIGVRAGEAARKHPIEFRRSIDVLLDWASEGLLRPHISHRFTLDDASAALATLSERRATGRVVITVENQSCPNLSADQRFEETR
jgi:NADPH:quinone reductase